MPANQSLEQPVTLLPCPFCGEELRQVPMFYNRDDPTQEPVYHAIHSGVVTDDDCLFSGKGLSPENWAKWNTRSAIQAQGTDEKEIPNG